jgi:hypothetical protein
LFTVPVSVMRVVSSITPPYCVRGRFSKVFPFSAGLEVFIKAIAYSPLRNLDELLALVLRETWIAASSLEQAGGGLLIPDPCY